MVPKRLVGYLRVGLKAIGRIGKSTNRRQGCLEIFLC